MSNKRNTKAGSAATTDDGFDQIITSLKGNGASSSNDKLAGYGIAGFFVALLPAYLYHSVFDLSVTDNAPLYLAITLAAAAMLALAYRNVEAGTHFFLAASRKSGRYSSSKSQQDTDALLAQESLSWSVFLNNAIFGALFLFFAFYAFKSIDTLYNYILSVLLAAAATWQLSNGSAPRS